MLTGAYECRKVAQRSIQRLYVNRNGVTLEYVEDFDSIHIKGADKCVGGWSTD